MDLFTLLWVVFIGAAGLYIGLASLLKGEITTTEPLNWEQQEEKTPAFTAYLLTAIFILFGTGIITTYFVSVML